MVLQTIRERLNGVLAFFILGILIIPFAFFGVTQYFTSNGEQVIARVNDQQITILDFNQSFANYRRRMQSLMGASFDAEQFDSPVARRDHLDSMVDREVLTQTVQQMGLSVDDQRLAQSIRELPAFQVGGVFNSDVYASQLTSQNTTPAEFEVLVRNQMIMAELPELIAGSSIATPSEVNHMISLQDQKRSFEAILFPASGIEDSEEITEEAIQAYYDAHPDEFRSEEQIVIEYLELDGTSLESEVGVSDDDLRAQFEQQQARFVNPEERLASHILINVASDADEATKATARQTAEDLAERARAGEDFAELAREGSEDLGSASIGGDLGWVTPGVMVQGFEDALYELNMERPISDPVQTSFGWHVIQLREIKESSGMSFEEAKPLLLEEYESQEAERRYLDRADRLVDLIYEDPTTLLTASETLGLEVMEVGPFSRLGGEGIAGDPDVIRAAFSDLVLLQESVSDPIDLGDLRMVMIRMKEHIPEATRPLEEVRDQVVLILQNQHRNDIAKQQAETFVAELDADPETTMTSLAEAQSLQPINVTDATRRSFEHGFQLIQEVFKLPAPEEGASTDRIVEAGDGYAFVRLTGVNQGELPEGSALTQQQYERQIANGAATTETLALLRHLKSKADVEIFEETFNDSF